MALQLHTDGELHMLVHSWKCFSPTKIINKEIVLKSIHLDRNISIICFNNTVLELILDL